MKVKLIFAVFCIVGLGMGYGAYYMFNSTKELLKSGVEVEAKVVELEYHRSDDSGVYYPVFEYNYNNRLYVIRSSSGSNPPSYDQGEMTTLTINKDRPQEFVAPDFFSRWGGASIVGVFSFVFSMIGVFGLRSTFRKEARKKMACSKWSCCYGQGHKC